MSAVRDRSLSQLCPLLLQDRGNGSGLDSMRSLEQFLPAEGGGSRSAYGHQEGKGSKQMSLVATDMVVRPASASAAKAIKNSLEEVCQLSNETSWERP